MTRIRDEGWSITGPPGGAGWRRLLGACLKTQPWPSSSSFVLVFLPENRPEIDDEDEGRGRAGNFGGILKHALKLFSLLILCGALLPLWLGAAEIRAAEKRILSEYEVKAALIYKLTLFVDWPASAFPHNEAPVVIGVLGQDPFGPHLRKIIEGKRIRNRPLVLKPCHDLAEAKACHVLFVSSSEKPNFSDILADLRNQSALTVGDVENFAAQGGIINLLLAERTVRLQINPDAARRAGLRISSQVLEMAQIVGDSKLPPKSSR